MVPLDSWLANCLFAGNTEDFLELKIHKAYLWLKMDPVHWFIFYSTPKLRNRYINIQYYNIKYREIYRDKVLFDSNVLLLGALEPWNFMTFHSVGTGEAEIPGVSKLAVVGGPGPRRMWIWERANAMPWDVLFFFVGLNGRINPQSSNIRHFAVLWEFLVQGIIWPIFFGTELGDFWGKWGNMIYTVHGAFGMDARIIGKTSQTS